LRDVAILEFFMEAGTLADGLEAGFREQEIERALDLGVIEDSETTSSTSSNIWETYNWQRAAFVAFAPQNSNPTGRSAVNNGAEHRWQSNCLSTESSVLLDAMLQRRTQRFFSEQPVARAVLQNVIAELATYMQGKQWLSAFVVVQAVDELPSGVYKLDSETATLITQRHKFARKDLLDCLHGQWWLNGGGLCWFFTVSFAELKTASYGYPSSYVDLLRQLGAAGQVLIESVYKHGLGAWMTPALSETLAAKLLGLDERVEEALYFFKIGLPEQPCQERRSPI
jgi:hypothetical protein